MEVLLWTKGDIKLVIKSPIKEGPFWFSTLKVLVFSNPVNTEGIITPLTKLFFVRQARPELKLFEAPTPFFI